MSPSSSTTRTFGSPADVTVRLFLCDHKIASRLYSSGTMDNRNTPGLSGERASHSSRRPSHPVGYADTCERA